MEVVIVLERANGWKLMKSSTELGVPDPAPPQINYVDENGKMTTFIVYSQNVLDGIHVLLYEEDTIPNPETEVIH